MGVVERKTAKTERLELLPCPICHGSITVRDWGYSSFNPGRATCNDCGWFQYVGNVEDQWGAGLAWNKLQPTLTDEAIRQNAEDEIARREEIRNKK